MKASSRRAQRRAACLAAATALCVASNATAQTHGWALDRFDPTPAGDTSFVADRPWYNGDEPFALRFGLVADYAHNPLVTRVGAEGSGIGTVFVENMLVLHAQAGISLFDRLNVHLSMPISLWQSGTAAGGFSPMSAAAAGDPRIGVRVRVLNHAESDRFSLHVGGDFYLHAGLFGLGESANTTDSAFRGRIYAVAAGRVGAIAYSATVGGHVRPTLGVGGTAIGPDLFLTAALGYVALHDRLTVGLEFFGSTVIDRAFEWTYVNGEVLAGAHYLIADQVLVGLGAGPGLSQGVGTPDVRVLAQVAWAPMRRASEGRPLDTDHDGVTDEQDQCVSVPQGDLPDAARPGCPVGDADRDGVLDPDDQCLEQPAGDHPNPTRRGCPDGDRDHDGVLDSADQCADEAQGEHPDPTRGGCPDGDDDHDGVLNSADQCRTEPQGSHPDTARVGCPLPDRDHDTVPDATDHCPDQPGAPDTDPLRNGCPGEVSVANCQLNIARPVHFAVSSDVILARSNGVLTAVARALNAATNIHRLAVDGHTDDAAADAFNQMLSERRAASVVRWLTAHGIEAARLEAHGFGESHPIVPITGLVGRALLDARAANRRVEFRIIDGGPTCTDQPASGGAR